MSTKIEQSRKRKRQEISLGSSTANFFRHQPLKNVFSHHSSDPAPPRLSKISTPTKGSTINRSLKRRLPAHTSRKRQSTRSPRANADSIQLASAGSDSDRNKSIQKSIAELPKLFSRFIGLGSKSETKTADRSESKCSARNITTDLQTPNSKSHRWTKLMTRLALKRILPESHQSQPLISSMSNTDSSSHSNLKPNTILKSPSSSKSDPFGDTPSISAPILEPIRVKHPSWRRIRRKYYKKRFPEPLEIGCTDRNESRIGKNPVESPVPDRVNLPPSFISSSSKSYPFGDVPFIPCPVLKPVHVAITASITSFAKPASTQIVKSAQSETVSAPSRSTRRLQQISKLKTAALGSSCGSSDPNMDVKVCLESARAKLSHLKVTHSSLSADSLGPDQCISASKLDSNIVGQVLTSTRMALKSLPQNKMQEIVPASSSTNVLTSDSSSPRYYTLCSSTSRSGNLLQETEHKKSAHFITRKSDFVTKSGHPGRIIKTSAKVEVSQPHSENKEEFIQFSAASSSFSSSSTNFQNSSETINSSSSHKRASMTNLLLADSTSSLSAGSNGEVCHVSHNPNTSRDSSSLVCQKCKKVKRRKPQGKRKFFRKLRSAFSATDELEESKSKPSVSERKNLVCHSKKKAKGKFSDDSIRSEPNHNLQ